MFHKSSVNFWYLAFNPAAKARPNFGLKGVGRYQPGFPYHSVSSQPLFIAIAATFFGIMYVAKACRIEAYIEENSGGGPQLMVTPSMEEAINAKPWEFKFLPGEGYAKEPRYLETGYPLEHLKDIDPRNGKLGK